MAEMPNKKQINMVLPNLNMIAAAGNNLELGYQNRLLCHLPKDLKRFKEITSGHTVLMGDRTWESLPVKPLPNRKNLVLTLNRDADYKNCQLLYSMEEALEVLAKEPKAFIIGGATVYKLFLPYTQTLYLTRMLSDFQADAFFPAFNEDEWILKEDEFSPKDEKNAYDLRFHVWERK